VPFEAVAAMTRAAFVDHFGTVFEDAPWVAHETWAGGPFADVEALHAAMVSVMLRAGRERRLDLVRAHPDLATGRAVSAVSAREQQAAGIGALSREQRVELLALNDAYRKRFGFPFVICAREQTAETILAAARGRVGADRATEELTALAEISKIARLRLAELVA